VVVVPLAKTIRNDESAEQKLKPEQAAKRIFVAYPFVWAAFIEREELHLRVFQARLPLLKSSLRPVQQPPASLVNHPKDE
jgi:hypothetical protein